MLNRSQPILISGAIVLTMDDQIGDFASGDVLIEDGRVAGVAASIRAPEGVTVIDGTGKIVIPGLVNCHMHTWQTALRGLTSKWTLFEYFRWVHAGLATVYRPEDLYIGTLAGALGQIDPIVAAGATEARDPAEETRAVS